MPDDQSLSAADMQARMGELRSELRTDVTQTTAAAKRLTDWRYVVYHFPWASAAAVAGLGFMLVPRKRERPLVDEAALEKMVAEKRVVVIPQKQEAAKKGLIGSIVGLALAAGTRAAMNYVSHRFTDGNQSPAAEMMNRLRTPK